MGRGLRVALVIFGCLIPASDAGAEVQMQALLNEDGSGRLFVNTSGEPPWSWEQCQPGPSQCNPFGSGRDINIGSAPPNTVFRVTGNGDSGLSPLWKGRVSVASPPSVLGEIQANELVVPWLAGWSGGWEGDFDQTQLAACIRPDGSQCTSITEPKYTGGCRNGGTTIDPFFTGQYLRIADRRYGTGSVFTMEAAGSPYGHPIWKESGVTAVTMLGRIQPADEPPEQGCGPTPVVEASISAKGVASVQCRLNCRATLFARQGRHRAGVSRELEALPGVASDGAIPKLQLRARQLKRFDRGVAHLTVKVNGRRVAKRTVRLRPAD